MAIQYAKAEVWPVLKPGAHGGTIIGYNVWAWVGNKMFGEVHGTKRFVKTKAEASRIAREYRKMKLNWTK